MRADDPLASVVVIRLMGLASGRWSRHDGRRSPHDGEYLTVYNPSMNGHDRAGVEIIALIQTTPHLSQAKRFGSMHEAMEYARQVDERQPYRPDGQPNRPLTAYTLEFLRL